MTFQESEAMRKQQKRDNEAALEAFRVASAERIVDAKMSVADAHARVLDIVVVVCALVCVAAVVV